MAINASIVEYTVRYDDTCKTQPTCNVPIKVTEKMTAPIFFYYALDNFYQNHRRYIKSRSNKQLAGNEVTYDDIKSACDPILNNSQLDNGITKSVDGTDLDMNAIASPCGLIARSFFNGITI